MHLTRRTRKAVLIPLLYLVAVVGVNAFDDGAASATEAHVSATCRSVSVYATDHGQTATVTDAYVLDATGAFNGPESARLRAVFIGLVLSTGPDAGSPGPPVEKPFTLPAGSWTVALSLLFSDGLPSTGAATMRTPCDAPTTTVSPTTAPPSTTATTAPTGTTAPATVPDPGVEIATTVAPPNVTLPRTGANPASATAAAGAALLLVGVALALIARRWMPVLS